MVDDRKSSTMNSIFLGSTLEKPNVELIINAVATILHSQMLEVSLKWFKRWKKKRNIEPFEKNPGRSREPLC